MTEQLDAGLVAGQIEEHPDPSEAEAREAISGNLCRCTGYQNIVKAVLRAAELSAPPTSAAGDGGVRA